MHRAIVAVAAATAFAFPYANLRAQVTPDAGSILRDQPKPPPPRLAPVPALPAGPSVKPPVEAAGPRILVRSFRIVGATLFPEDRLKALLENLVGRELTLEEIRAGALRIVSYYLDNGYLARVLLSEQEIRDGVITFTVIEGRLGSLRLDIPGGRIDNDRLRRFIEQRVEAGQLLRFGQMGEALSIVNEQPGVEARATLVPGAAEGTVDMVVNAADTPLVSGSATANNHGSRATGEAQASATLALNNPLGLFDSASLLANASRGTTYVRGDYSLALGSRGLRAGINASYLDYRLVLPAFSALEANGTARTVGLSLSYPLARRTDFALTFAGTLDRKMLRDQDITGETGSRRVSVAGLGLSGFRADSWFGGGANNFSGTLVFGDSDQRNAAAFAADQVGRRVQGSFTKLAYSLGRVQPLNETWTLNASLRGQYANKNLDSSERFQTGGPYGVRAYPVGEATADQAWLMTVALARNLGEGLSGSVFVDAARARIDRNEFGGTVTPNTYSLSALGVSLDWRLAPRAVLSLGAATRLETNPVRDAAGNDSDGRPARARAWINLAVQL